MTADPAPSSRKHVAIALVAWGDKFLAGWRSEGAPLAGYAEFPGGKVEPGESPEAAAERECREEAGLAVHAVAVDSRVDHDYDYARLTLHFIRCEPVGEPAPLRPPFRWLTRRELAALPFPPANAELIRRLTGQL